MGLCIALCKIKHITLTQKGGGGGGGGGGGMWFSPDSCAEASQATAVLTFLT